MVLWRGRLQWTQYCNGICYAGGNAVAAVEILMMGKYCDAFFLGPIESGMLCMDALCNASVLWLKTGSPWKEGKRSLESA